LIGFLNKNHDKPFQLLLTSNITNGVETPALYTYFIPQLKQWAIDLFYLGAGLSL